MKAAVLLLGRNGALARLATQESCAARLLSTLREQPGSEANKTSTPPSTPPPSFPEATPPSTSSGSDIGTDQSGATVDQLPGWLRGPQKRQTTVLKDDWVEVEDRETGEKTWRNASTGESVGPGMPKPMTWHQVVDKGSGLLYYWCPATGETTAIGEPKPGPYGRNPAYLPDSADAPGDRKARASKVEAEEPPPTIIGMYNNPLGYLLVGMAVVGVIIQIVRSP